MVDPVHERLHIRVAAGKFFRIEGPIAHVVLPSVIERDPDEAHTFHGRQGVMDLFGLKGPSVSPGAPDGAIRVIRR